MRKILLGMLVVSAIGFTGATTMAAPPAGGIAIGEAAQANQPTEAIDCRRYPHRHRNARPHGWGFGCKGKSRTPKAAPKVKS